MMTVNSHTMFNPSCFDEEDQIRSRKRRRPQIDHRDQDGVDSSLFTLSSKEDDSPTRQKETQTLRRPTANEYKGDATRKGVSPILLWITLLFACCHTPHHSHSRLFARAMNVPESANHRHLRQTRKLQKELNVNTPSVVPALDYLELPKLLWMRKDSQKDEFSNGNSVQVSPFDQKMLYATTRAGDLRVVAASNGMPIARVSPRPRSLTEDGVSSFWSVHSKSGMAFGTLQGSGDLSTENSYSVDDDDQSYNDYLAFLLNNGIAQNQKEGEQKPLSFVVYAIVDEAPAESRFLPKTRVVCVSIPDHTILWTSAGLPGTPNGSPLVYYANDPGSVATDNDGDAETESGTYIVLTHNSILIRPDNTTRTTGHLTVLDPLSGNVKWTQSEWIRDDTPKGYGPPQVVHSPTQGGGYSGGPPGNKNDVVIWTSSDQEGRGRIGNVYSFQMKSPSELQAEEITNKKANGTDSGKNAPLDPFMVRVLRRVRWNSIARPTLNRDGTELYVGVTGNAVRAWSGVAKFDETADWSARLVPFHSGTNASSQVYDEDVVMSTAPVLSADEKRLFVISARNETICLEASTGTRMWSSTVRGASLLLGEPKASPDNKRLYVIMSHDGRVNGVEQANGKVLWSFGCDKDKLTPGTECETPSVSADFDLSKDGQVLYYAAADGRIVALKLGKQIVADQGNEKEPLPPISTHPDTTSSTKIEFDDDDNFKGPLVFDDYSVGSLDGGLHSKDGKKKNAGKIVGSLFAITLCLAVAFVSLVYVMKAKGVDPKSYININWSNYRLPRKGAGANIRDKPHSFVARVSRGMFRVDGAGDDMIISHLSEDEKSIEQEFGTLWVDPTHSNPKPSHNDDDDDHSTSDRLNAMLSSTNEVAPISQNFGFGQSVMI